MTKELVVIGENAMAEPYLVRLERLRGDLKLGIEIDADIVSLSLSDMAFLLVFIDSVTKQAFDIAEMKLAYPDWVPFVDLLD